MRLLFNPKPSWHKYSWIGAFLGQIGNYRDNTMETVRLAIEAREHLFSVAKREGVEFDLEKRGILHVYEDRKGFEAASKVNVMYREGSLDCRPVVASEIASIEPAIRGNFYGGFFTPSDSTGDIHKFTRGLAQACARKGMAFRFDSDITDIRAANGGFTLDVVRSGGGEEHRFDKIVICAGVGSWQFASMLGDHVNVYPVKGYSITVCLDGIESQQGAPWVSLLDDAAKIVTSRLGHDRFRVAGTAEINGVNRDIRADRIAPLVAWVRRYFPDVSTSRVIPWAGLRPMLPNMLPRVGAGKRPAYFITTGHGYFGWTLSMATAEILASVVDAAQQRDAAIATV